MNQDSSSSTGQPGPPHLRHFSTPSRRSHKASATSATSRQTLPAAAGPPIDDSKRYPLPFSFPPLFQPNSSSTSLVPSTAEGKPVPLDDNSTAHRTSALRELSTNFPSRHRYAKSTGAQNSTYSQPVLVRTYSGDPSRPSSATRVPAVGDQRTDCGVRSSTGSHAPTVSMRRVVAFRTSFSGQRNGLLSMARTKTTKRSRGEEAPNQLPPVEAFSFKSMMETHEADGGDSSTINADLDRIAEICARSHISLSNQYEVHVTPYGSGAAFLASASSARQQHLPNHHSYHHHQQQQHQHSTGPTLQAVTSDDERNTKRHRKRRSTAGRKRSVAMGTLETIISSSGSSEESKTKTKSAAELTEEVRGRAARKELNGVTGDTSTAAEGGERNSEESKNEDHSELKRGKSSSFATAMMESTRQTQATVTDNDSRRISGATLLSEPAWPQTSTSHLEVRSEPDDQPAINQNVQHGNDERQSRNVSFGTLLDDGQRCPRNEPPSQRGISLGALGGWAPTWSFPSLTGFNSSSSAPAGVADSSSQAEGVLRDLLRTTHSKSKGNSITRTM